MKRSFNPLQLPKNKESKFYLSVLLVTAMERIEGEPSGIIDI